METSYHGFFVGPTSSSETADAGRRGRVVEGRDGRVWIVLELAREAEALACALGDETWLWEVELRNDVGDEDGESHSGTICGRVCRAGELLLRTRDDLREEGFIRGGVMEDVALEYVQAYTRIETISQASPPAPTVASLPSVHPCHPGDAAAGSDREVVPAPGPSASPAPLIRARTDGHAATILEHLLQRGDLEIVNHHARRTLLAPIEECLLEPTAASVAAAILVVLEDADEVVEVYADEAELEAFIAELRRTPLP